MRVFTVFVAKAKKLPIKLETRLIGKQKVEITVFDYNIAQRTMLATITVLAFPPKESAKRKEIST